MADHSKLFVWQRAHQLALDVHRASAVVDTRTAPGLRAQICRAAAAIPANIAEGCGQEHAAQFARFLTIAIASTNEVENHLAFAKGLGCELPSSPSLLREVSEIRRMLIALRKRVRAE
jgi:four helix bundle protein